MREREGLAAGIQLCESECGPRDGDSDCKYGSDDDIPGQAVVVLFAIPEERNERDE